VTFGNGDRPSQIIAVTVPLVQSLPPVLVPFAIDYRLFIAFVAVPDLPYPMTNLTPQTGSIFKGGQCSLPAEDISTEKIGHSRGKFKTAEGCKAYEGAPKDKRQRAYYVVSGHPIRIIEKGNETKQHLQRKWPLARRFIEPASSINHRLGT